MLRRSAVVVGLALLVNGCPRTQRSHEGMSPDALDLRASDAGSAQRDVDVGPLATRAPSTTDGPERIEGDDQVRTIALDHAPTLTIRTLGVALIEVTLAEGVGRWKTVEIQRPTLAPSDPADPLAPRIELDTFQETARRGASLGARRHLHAAIPGATYAYRARVGAGAWSSEVNVRAPVPLTPPAAPTAVTARAESPFAARISWSSTARGAFGFEVQSQHAGGEWTRAALVDPTSRELVHHFRTPGEAVSYRVRAFNPRGISTSAPVTLTMPEPSPPAKRARPPPCISPVRHAQKSSGCNPEIDTLDDGSGHVVQNVPGDVEGCRRHLIGQYEGCTRDFGAFTLQADVTIVNGHTDEGWPLLHAIAGAGEYVGAQIHTLQFSRGRYTVVDTVSFCGTVPESAPGPTFGRVHDELTRCAPPFEVCQLDPSM